MDELVIKTRLDTKDFTKQIEQTEKELQDLERYYEKALDPKAKEDPEAIRKLGVEVEKTRNKLQGLYKQQLKVDQQGLKQMPQDLENVDIGIGKIIKKVGKWALAIFSVRSAYMLVRQSASMLGQYDEKIGQQIEGIRLALASALAPVIQWIIGLVQTLIVYLDYIIDKWFGFSILAKANALNMKKTSASAKEIKKSLAGFDEINMVSETKSDGGGSSSPILPNKANVEIPDWLKMIVDNKDLFFAIAGLFGLAKVTGWISNIGALSGALSGLLPIIGGIVITYLCAKKVWEDIQNLKKNLDEVATKTKKAHEDWIEKEEDINVLINTGNVNRKNGYKQLQNSQSALSKILGLDARQIQDAKDVADNIGKQIDREVELAKEKGATNEQINRIKQSIIEQYQYNLALIDVLKQEGQDTSDIEQKNLNLIKNYQDMGGEVTEVKDELGKINAMKFDDKTIDVKANTTKAEKSISDLFKGLLDTITLNISGQGVRNTGKKLGTGIFSRIFGAKGLVYGNVPKLAMGGLINNPGAGVPYRGSIIGERGPEAVLPLTQTDQMQLLGSYIGKYITINAEIVNNMNGRVISRELQKIQNQDNFSNNM